MSGDIDMILEAFAEFLNGLEASVQSDRSNLQINPSYSPLEGVMDHSRVLKVCREDLLLRQLLAREPTRGISK